MSSHPVRPLLGTLLGLALIPAIALAGDLGPLEPLADLHRAVHESLGLPEPLIERLLEAGTPDVQLPVVGFLAGQLGQTPERIAELHRGGLSFLDITLRFGAGPELFYVPFERDPGPPYGKAWGYYKKTPRAQWGTIRLSDDEIVDLVNLRVARDYYGVPAERVVEMRKAQGDIGKLYRALADETGKGRGPKGQPGEEHGQGKGKGPGKGKGKHGSTHGGGHPPGART